MAVNSGLNLLGSQFVEVGTDTDADINALVLPSAEVPGLNADYAFQTTLMTWNGSSYTIYGYCAAGQGTDMFGVSEWDGKWISNGMDAIADVELPAGTGFWIQTTGNSTVTMMGQVASAESTSVDVTAGLNLISASYPKAINVQDVVPSAEVPGLNGDYAFETTLMTWNGSSYTIYGYCAAGQGTDMFGVPEWDGKWISNGMDAIADVELPAGSGFWVQTTGSGTVTFAK